MKLSTLKNILLPLGIMWTVCPIIGVGFYYLTEAFGPAAFIITLFVIGILCLIGLGGIHLWEKRKARIDQ